jgi:hypothetical protein
VSLFRTGLHGHSGPGVIPAAMMGVSGAMGFQPADVPKTESDALIALYNATNGPGWTNDTNWLTDPVVGNWFGVTVAGGHVTRLQLPNNNLNGSLATWSPDFLPSLTHLVFNNNGALGGDLNAWVLPLPLIYLYLNDCTFTGDLGSWALNAALQFMRIHRNTFSGNIGSWVIPVQMLQLYIYGNAFSGAPNINTNVLMRQYYYNDNGLVQADVDAVLLGIYNRRMAFTWPAPVLLIAGTNAAPSGIYQPACPPGTGHEYEFELENDSCGGGFILWTITAN